MRVARLLALCCSVAFAFSASATDKIEGAFGKKLGDVFDPATAIGKSELTDGTPIYQFSTTNGFRSFTKYYALITPKTKKIYSIWGVGSVANTETGQKEQAVIMQILEQKYGPRSSGGFFAKVSDIDRISQGNRYVATKISGFTDVTLKIVYYDDDLGQLAEKERVESAAKAADKSGL